MVTKRRLTVGMRARFIPLATKKRGHDYWCKKYGGREVLLRERSSGSGNFSVYLLGKGVTTLKKKCSGIVEDEVAWIPEENLEFVNDDFDTNLDFIDWYSNLAIIN